jgi:hypothetical protein
MASEVNAQLSNMLNQQNLLKRLGEYFSIR